jgi:hypothetical protein
MALRRGGAGNSNRGDRLLVSAANGGLNPANRELRITVDGEVLSALSLSIPAGMQVHEVIDIPETPAEIVRAGIGPGDALPDDDVLEIAAADLQAVTVGVSEKCGTHLRAALASHAALTPVGGGELTAQFRVLCREQGTVSPGPALYIRQGQGGIPVAGPLIWLPGAGPLRGLSLDPDWLVAQPGGVGVAPSQVLLRAGDAPLILYDAAAQIIDVRLDLAAPTLVRQPEYPLLIAGLMDLLLTDTRASEGLLSVANRDSVSIAPKPLSVSGRRPIAATDTNSRDLTGAIILAALLSLIMDPALRGRRLTGGLRTSAAATGSG